DGGDCTPCYPECTDGMCGDDGCGGTCACDEGLVCTGAGTCEADLPGSSCAEPGLLDLSGGSASAAGDLSDPAIANDSYNRTDCGSTLTWGGGFRDQAWMFTAAQAGTYRVTATPTVNSHDLML